MTWGVCARLWFEGVVGDAIRLDYRSIAE